MIELSNSEKTSPSACIEGYSSFEIPNHSNGFYNEIERWDDARLA
jgi:hypothetical protein